MTHGIILEPDYAALRERFAREARDRADTILSDLLPEGLIEPEHIKAVQLAVLRAMQSVLVPINICIQATAMRPFSTAGNWWMPCPRRSWARRMTSSRPSDTT
jgi:hypothetical protein